MTTVLLRAARLRISYPRLLALARANKVVLTAHMASATLEARVEMGETVIVNIRAFVDNAAIMLRWVTANTPVVYTAQPYPDYHAEEPGGSPQGYRTHMPLPIDGRKLGKVEEGFAATLTPGAAASNSACACSYAASSAAMSDTSQSIRKSEPSCSASGLTRLASASPW